MTFKAKDSPGFVSCDWTGRYSLDQLQEQSEGVGVTGGAFQSGRALTIWEATLSPTFHDDEHAVAPMKL